VVALSDFITEKFYKSKQIPTREVSVAGAVVPLTKNAKKNLCIYNVSGVLEHVNNCGKINSRQSSPMKIRNKKYNAGNSNVNLKTYMYSN
jgi:replication-associated recombination protein RarA